MKGISENIIILTILLFMQSCIKEEVSECEDTALRLRFQYTLNNQYSDLFASEVRRVTVYVFDSEGKYVGTYSDTGDKLANNYVMAIPLPVGNYQAIVFCDNINTFSAGWVDARTNSFSRDFQPGITGAADFRIQLNSTEGPEGFLLPESLPGDLYGGYITNAPSTYDTSSITNVDLMKDTKNIKVKISGLNFLAQPEVAPEIYITATNGKYKNDNSIDTSDRKLKYRPHYTSVTGSTMSSDLRTMRLVIGNAPTLVIKHPSVPGDIINRDITEMILSNPKYVTQKDLDREDTFAFEVNIKQIDNNIVISVSINDWEINTIIPAND